MSSQPDELEGLVADVIDSYTVVINRGRRDDVSEGDTFYLYRVLGPFDDPKSGENLGSTRDVIAKVEVDTVEEKFCVASTPKSYRSNVAQMMIGFSKSSGSYEQEALPTTGEGGAGTKTVEVGTSAFLVRARSSKEVAEELATDPEDYTVSDEKTEEG